MKQATLTMCVRRTFAVDTPKGIGQVISDNPTYVSFEINHKNGRNFKIIGKAIAPVFKKIF
ncbi:phage repressor protein [Vibrio fluvialis]|nr:phage repressor protein [Vibrio fluvialis]MCE7635578.1 phage repressor protein [Vibrio fluvialis]MCE7644093.1 phage repressor protein [Vibrio fluvialis]